jgi:hypothetical protein
MVQREPAAEQEWLLHLWNDWNEVEGDDGNPNWFHDWHRMDLHVDDMSMHSMEDSETQEPIVSARLSLLVRGAWVLESWLTRKRPVEKQCIFLCKYILAGFCWYGGTTLERWHVGVGINRCYPMVLRSGRSFAWILQSSNWMTVYSIPAVICFHACFTAGSRASGRRL